MPEHWTFILLGACFLVVLGLFYYYVNRQLQGIQTAQQSISGHLLFQQKVLDKHDQLLSQTLGVPRSFSSEDSVVPPRRRTVSFDDPVSLVHNDQGSTSSTTMDTPAAGFPSAATLGPMVGTLLNMFQHIQPPSTGHDPEDDEGEENEIDKEEILTREELQKELSKELEELQPPPLGGKDAVKVKEGRIDEEETTESIKNTV